MNYKVEEVFYHEELLCVVILTRSGHRCGYVGLPPSHPLYGKDYSDNLHFPTALDNLKSEPIGKRSLLSLLCWNGEDSSLDILCNVHGGVTYSRLGDDYPLPQISPVSWWIGFDCAHLGDSKDFDSVKHILTLKQFKQVQEWNFDHEGIVRSQSYVANECRNLATQLTNLVSCFLINPNSNDYVEL